eukprot:CAMPEP_0113547310 /NCGR_PEP_ID=MMETSP0015_2-20120614/12284_1 /TAXON_ID=2838 /ORGANISM="Odontella" /LENGTH=644 /DNA_ID=CAMNT_0000447849 /DNA_START=23 /DNA_END=1957 /DNA_ORIENTATION=+ /assembly_acc=CAM_ASM_000160
MRASRRYTRLLLLPLASAILATDAGTTAAEEASAEGDPREVASIEVDVPGSAAGEDRHEQCGEWAASGECEKNPEYMLQHCFGSCGSSTLASAKVYVYEGEDAGVGAFRFAEQYSAHFDDAIPIPTVLDVAKRLQSKLAEDSEGYTPPKELTHCGKRTCSAGKLWKRAEEMRKADMHDVAGADLIRALLKTGLETDFVERCERSLHWAFGSIRRQREREKREAVEEAKLEKRREEERAAMAEAEERKKEYEADWVKFGVKVQESVASGGGTAAELGADGTVEADADVDDLTTKVKQTFIHAGPQGGNWSETIQLIKKIPPSGKTVEILLIEARCHEMLGNYKSALSAAGRLVQKAASHEPWVNGSPRMMAATLGANAAMQLGLSENAISFYQTVLKFDPEQQRARKQYRGLKKVVKQMNKAEEQIQKGYNKAASGFVDDCLSAMRGLDVDSPLFRSKIQLKQCTILSGMGRYEEALDNCDTAVDLRIGHDSVSPASRKEAHLVRAEALLLDMDYDEAVQDFRAAFDLVPDDDDTGEKRELHQKLQSAIHQQEMWNGGQKDQRFNEHTGYPDGRPPQRDHAKILELPIDLEQREKDIKCAWLKKQFKALVRKYHPDKYKGNKKRGSRKFKEVKEAKEIISNAWDC